MSSCCQPARHGDLPAPSLPRPGTADLRGTVEVPSGPFLMGNDRAPLFAGDGEGPVRAVEVPAFRIDTTAVSVAAFDAFVTATGWVTEAERYGWSFVFVAWIAMRCPISHEGAGQWRVSTRLAPIATSEAHGCQSGSAFMLRRAP